MAPSSITERGDLIVAPPWGCTPLAPAPLYDDVDVRVVAEVVAQLLMELLGELPRHDAIDPWNLLPHRLPHSSHDQKRAV